MKLYAIAALLLSLLAWTKSNTGWVNIKDYGGIGDGLTDNVSAFSNAVVAAGRGAGVVYIPGSSNTYRMLSQFTWPSNLNNITILGDGQSMSVLEMRHSGFPSTGVGIYIHTVSNIWFKHLTIRGGSDSTNLSPYNLLVYGDGVFDSGAEGVEFYWARNAGFRTTANWPDGGSGVFIRDCYFHGIATTNNGIPGSGAAALITGYSDVTVSRTRFVNCGGNSLAHALYPSFLLNFTLKDCDFSGYRTDLSCGNGLTNVMISGNRFAGFHPQFGSTILGTPCLVVNNQFLNTVIGLADTRQMRFANNTITTTNDNAASMIYINDSTTCNVTVENNDAAFTGGTPPVGYYFFMQAGNSTNTIVRNNTITDYSVARFTAGQNIRIEGNQARYTRAFAGIYGIRMSVAGKVLNNEFSVAPGVNVYGTTWIRGLTGVNVQCIGNTTNGNFITKTSPQLVDVTNAVPSIILDGL